MLLHICIEQRIQKIILIYSHIMYNIKYKKNMKIQKICQLIRKQPVPKRIAIVFIINIMIVLTVIIISLTIQYSNIKLSQQQIPNIFFKSYNEYSLEEVAHKAKNLILSVIDFRMSFIMTVRNTILSNLTKANENLNSTQISSYFKNESNTQNCIILRSNSSIFDCKMDLYTKFVIESGWEFQIRRPLRRFNLIYQNLNDQNDIMIKTISQVPDFIFTDIRRLNFQFDLLNNHTNILFISSFYQDVYGTSLQNLISFSTQLVFNDYRILIELQTFGSFIKQSISRMTYSDDANIVVLQLNDTVVQKYRIVAFYQQPEPSINYTNLLDKKHYTNHLANNQIIYSFSLPFSSIYSIGSLNYIDQPLLNQNFILIIYSPRITKTMESNIYGFTSRLYSTLVEISVVLFVLVAIWMIVNILLLANQMSQVLSSIRDTITRYTKQPEQYNEIINKLNNQNFSDYLVGFILKSIISIIKIIEHNKQKFKKKSKKIQKDYYPLNLFEKQFMQKQAIIDQQRFEKLKLKLIQNQYKTKL